MNKTKVISNFTFEDISKSYRWDGSRGTFPANYWLDILMEVLWKGTPTTKIEKEYRQYLPVASKTEKSSNNMYISVLLNRMLLNKDSYGILKKQTYDSARDEVIKYINWVVGQAEYKFDLKKNWQKNISDWRRYLSDEKFEIEEVNEFIDRSINDKVKEVKYKFEYNEEKINKDDFTDNISNSSQEIGRIGEEILYRALVSEYGFDNVTHDSRIDPYSPFDISVKMADGERIYYEVKSSKSIKNVNWFISRREYEFYSKHKKNYKLAFIKNVFVDQNKQNKAVISIANNPIIKIDNERFGIENGAFLVTPIKYKGLI